MEIKGYTYGYNSHKGMYTSPEAAKSRELLMQTGINWVCLAFSVRQKSFASTEILYDYRKNVSDLEIIKTINEFHDHGIKVCLKPMIDTEDGMWRALINFPDHNMFGKDPYWDSWFESYRAYLTHYAEIASYTGCEMFCLGCEMLGTERKEKHWRETIAAVRRIYSGKLVYNTNHGKEENALWYDEIDYIGTSAYYPVAPVPTESDIVQNSLAANKAEVPFSAPSSADQAHMSSEWQKIADHLKEVSARTGKQIIFMEIGCRSAAGCASMPWDFTHREFPFSEEEQANFYESSLSIMSKQPWFAGYFWWDWSTIIYDDRETAMKDMGFNIHLKKAEEVIKKWYKN